MKLSSTDIAYFKERVAFWIKELQCGHMSWSVVVADVCQGGLHETLLAETRFNTLSRWAKIYLYEDWKEYPINETTLDSTAFHEVCEGGLLADIRAHAEDREFTQEQFDIEIHRVVRILEKILPKEGVL